MGNNKIVLSLTFCISLFFLFFLTTLNLDDPSNDFIPIEVRKIVELSINDKILNEDYYSYLLSLKQAKPISFKSEYFEQMGLNKNQADLLKIAYSDGSTVSIYTGMTDEKGSKIYLRLKGSDIIFEASGGIMEIIKEKSDSDREYTFLESVHVSSVIAVKIENTERSMFLTLNGENEWSDQISGVGLNRLKVQNLINKIINLRVLKDSGKGDLFSASDTVQIETREGQVYTFFFDNPKDLYILIRNNNGEIYRVLRDKINFLDLRYTDLE